MNNKHVFSALIACCLCFAACSDADVNYLTGSTEVPQQVKIVRVEDLAGKAVIRYELPDDIHMKYVKAVYTVNGASRDVNASFYTDSLLVEGFPEAGEYAVDVYSVSYGGTLSEPVTVKVHPTAPPYRTAVTSITPSFGGMFVEYRNENRENLSVGVLKKMSNGQWVQIHMQYNLNGDSAAFSVRGQESTLSDFGVFVRDRWGHISDTVFASFTPWYEEACDKKLFSNAALPTDEYICHTWNTASQANNIILLWDGVTDLTEPVFHTRTTCEIPQQFTINLGREYQLSRFIVNSRYGSSGDLVSGVFAAGDPRYFELWGSLSPNPNGSYDNTWFKIGDYESLRPSGMTTAGTPWPDEDRAAGRAGLEYMVPDGTPPVQYIRFRTLQTWGQVKYVHLNELTPFGQRVE
jgi:hypothetical protein